MQSVITNLQLEIFLPGDYVVRYGSIGDTFFLLTSGRCDILDRRGDQFDTLKAGQHFCSTQVRHFFSSPVKQILQ